MAKAKSSGVVISSVSMILCGAINSVFNILRRITHLLGTVRTATQPDTIHWSRAALSVYDIYAIFSLSMGILAIMQIILGIIGVIYASAHTLRKKPISGAALPLFLGVICSIVGAVSTISLIISRQGTAFMIFALTLTQLAVPIIFSVLTGKFHRSLLTEKGGKL